MALIGFIAVVGIGLFFVVNGIAAALLSIGFSGRVEWFTTIIFIGVGSVLVYLALKYAPFVITWGAA